MTSNEIMLKALQNGKVIPSFSISYLPMMEPIVRACRDANSLGPDRRGPRRLGAVSRPAAQSRRMTSMGDVTFRDSSLCTWIIFRLLRRSASRL